jgi:hypothetical protein
VSSPEDLVERKLVECFPPDDVERARGALLTVDDARVRLAAVKLADGDVNTSECYASLAAIHWRDVVGPTEQPRFLAAGVEAADRADADSLMAGDRAEYEAWLATPGPYAR